jgi:hypothetical protein
MNFRSRIIRRILLIGAVILLYACDRAEQHRRRVVEEYQKRLIEMQKSGIVAGPSEPTFEEKHRIRLHLPMSEAEFLRILDSLKLSYRVFAEQGTDVPIPTPWHSDKLTHQINLDTIQKVYQILGEIDHAQQSREIYRAYIDKNGQLVYLENTYGYTGL